MILHLVPDDKFIDMAFFAFERVASGGNDFVMIGKSRNLKYIKHAPIKFVPLIEVLSGKFAKGMARYDFVVIHWLDGLAKYIVRTAPENTKFVWIGWGGDYYCYLQKNLYLPMTEKIVANLHNTIPKSNFKGRVKEYIKNKVIFRAIKDIGDVCKNIKYFAPVLREDYHLLADELECFKRLQYVDWNYGTLEDHFVGDQAISVNGGNILIGNSATPENNHLEAFHLIKDLDLHGRQIICPLSYGNYEYAKAVIDAGKRLFGSKFMPLTDFVHIDAYRELLSGCSIVIMNHLRQQALGNIVIMMHVGAKIFLNQNNPVYAFFRNRGAVIFTTNELGSASINHSLTDHEISKNRAILKAHWSREVILRKTRDLIRTAREGL